MGGLGAQDTARRKKKATCLRGLGASHGRIPTNERDRLQIAHQYWRLCRKAGLGRGRSANRLEPISVNLRLGRTSMILRAPTSTSPPGPISMSLLEPISLARLLEPTFRSHRGQFSTSRPGRTSMTCRGRTLLSCREQTLTSRRVRTSPRLLAQT